MGEATKARIVAKISDMGEVDARNDTSLAGRVSTGKKPLSQAAPAATEKALDMGRKWGVPAKSGNVLENVGSGAMAYGTGRAQELRASFAKDSVPDEFDRINQWMDTGDNKNLADAVRRVDNPHGAYTDADLIQKGGWTQAQIDEARKMNAALDAIPAWQRDVRRAANTIGGIGDTVAAAPVLGAEYGVQAGKNIDATLKNWKQVEQEVKGDEHAQSLFNLLTDIQRSDNEFVKTLTMFTTQRFQNYGILADAVGDYKAQKARYAADQSAENKAEVQRAGQGLRQAAASQVVQTAVFALMKIGADFLLHRWDKEQDENGDITAASVGKRFFDLYTESAAGNFLYGSEIYSALTNARDGKDYDVVSATNISAVNDLFAAFTKTVKLLRTDTGEMSEEELTAHHQKLNKAVLKDIQCGLELYGVPAANIRKVMQAFEGYWEDAQAIGRGEGFSFNSAPSSATGQYDRLYNAIQSGDSEEAAAAMKKLEQMNKTDKVDGELARRLKQYDADVLAAAKARNAGKARAEEKARKAVSPSSKMPA